MPSATSFTMSPDPSPRKGRGSAAANEDELILLLLASNPKLVLDYKAMSDLSNGTRTVYALQHRFRKLKASAKEMQTEHDGAEEAGDGKDKKAVIAEKPLAKRSRAVIKKENQGSEDEEGGKPKVTKRAKKGSKDDAEEEPVIKEEIRKAAQKLAEVRKDGLPEKVIVQKKGTARVVKKVDGLMGGGEEEVEGLKGTAPESKVKVKGKKEKVVEGGVTVKEEEDVGEGEDLSEMQFEF